MLEKDIEKIFRDEIKKAGGKAYKFTSPGNDGVPDRIVLFPDGRIVFVELKTDTGKLSKLQELQCRQIAELGQTVRVLHGLSEVCDFFLEFGLETAAYRLERRLAR
ncbi:MAG: VRR-NUC domain-containing protein [[Eubacterium] sulci]|nr:VRR-NUC domain-containing protein [[Eubacterium] sulci]